MFARRKGPVFMLLCPPVGGKCFQKWTVIICLLCDTAVMAGLLPVIETVVRNWCVVFGELLPVSASFTFSFNKKPACKCKYLSTAAIAFNFL